MMNNCEQQDRLDTSLVDSWSSALMRSDLENLATNGLEACLDAFLDEGIIKDIPFVSNVVSVYRIGRSINEQWYIKKLIAFLNELNNGRINEQEKKKYIDRITKDKKSAQRELEYVLILLDRVISGRKVPFLSRLFLAYIKGDIDWALFCQLTEVIDRLLPGDEECMNPPMLEAKSRTEMVNCALQRLQGLGILTPNQVPSAYDSKGNVLSTKTDGTYSLTMFGKTLASIILSKGGT